VSAAVTLPPGVALCHLPASFPLARGGALAGAVVAYELQGPADAPLVVVAGGISAGRHVSAHRQVPGPGWWEGVVGHGLAVDTTRVRVLAIDWLGGAGASTAPAADETFPFVATEDQADAIAVVLDALRVGAAHAFVGCSYGGMVGLQFAARHAARLARLCVVAAAHRSDPQASALRAVQRGIVRLGQRAGAPRDAVALARALAMVTYRTPLELRQRFGAGPAWIDGQPRFPVQDWLDARGAEFAAQWNAPQFVGLNGSIDAYEVYPAQVLVPTWLGGIDGDQLVPAVQVRELARRLPRLVRHVELRSRYGHDAFLKETAALRPLLQEVLA
jgi:homoserine O-acetyltransferase